jgi:glycosyltransferase involved in cell wall biosynthesis
MSSPSLSVLHISENDRFGGSGRSAYRIHSNLRRLGVRSRMLVHSKTTTDEDVDVISSRHQRFFDRLSYHFFERLSLQYVFYPSSFLLVRHDWFRQANVVQLFNTHANYFSHTALPLISRFRPVVWRLSDMWPLTGHCTHSFECERWKTGCGSCPILSDYPQLQWDTTAVLWKIKKSVYAHSDINVVAPSKWIAEVAQQSPLLGRFSIHRIPNGVDTSVFRPVNKQAARKLIGVDQGKRIILFSSHLIMNPHKGGIYMREALSRLAETLDIDNVLVLIVGRGAESWKQQLRFEVKLMGHITDDKFMAAVYSAADMFVLPTLADTFPNGVLESMACGTPPITFNVGGCPELVRHMETGYLAAHKDVGDLANGMKLLLKDKELGEKLGQRAVQVVGQEYTQELEGNRFKALYQSITSTRNVT